MEFTERLEKDKKFIFDCLDSNDIESIRSSGLSVRVGEKILKLSVVSEENIPGIDELKKEIRNEINARQIIVKEKINKKITEMTQFYTQMRAEYRRKEKELKDTLARSAPMPDVLESHAKKGLSLVKGNSKGALIWFVQGVYWPKTYDQLPIEPKFSKKMISNVIFRIDTSGNKVTGVSTRKPLGLSYFNHYHQSHPDCWGSWKYPKNWENPDDIINIARQAEAVLENIYPGSIADHNPRGLPRHNTIKRHVLPKKSEVKMGNLNQGARRAGITETMRSDDTEVWSL
jgi:hypothetical protein